jgi:hypothetical protein
MEGIDDTINLRITNNTSFTQSVSILGGDQDPNGTQPTILYQWDLSAENYVAINNTYLGVIGTPSLYSVINKKVNNIQDVVDNLNSFNLGTFKVQGNIIYIASNNYVFNKIDLF